MDDSFELHQFFLPLISVFTGAYFSYSDEGGSALRRKVRENYDPTRRQNPRGLVI